MKYKIIYTIIGLVFLMVQNVTFLVAQTNVFIGTAKIALGSNMTELQAIELAKIQCERDACEKAGVYVQSETKVENSMLVKDIIITFSAEIMKQNNFRHKKIIDNDVIYLIAAGEYTVDLQNFNDRLLQFKKEKKLEEKLEDLRRRYNDLILRIQRSEDYDNRRELLKEYQTLRESSKTIYIQDELSLTNKRISNLKDEFRDKIKEIENYMIMNSVYNISDKKINKENIIITINCKRVIRKSLINELEEIIKFGIETGVLRPFSEENLKFFTTNLQPTIFLICHDKIGRQIFKEPLFIFLIDFFYSRVINILQADIFNISNSLPSHIGIGSIGVGYKLGFDDLYNKLNADISCDIKIPNDPRIAIIKIN